MTRRLSRTVSAIHDRGDAPTTATLVGANSGRRSIVPLCLAQSSSHDPPDAPLLECPGDDHRWISEVPSQILSTRSSRRNRSGAYSRM